MATFLEPFWSLSFVNSRHTPPRERAEATDRKAQRPVPSCAVKTTGKDPFKQDNRNNADETPRAVKTNTHFTSHIHARRPPCRRNRRGIKSRSPLAMPGPVRAQRAPSGMDPSTEKSS